MTAAGLINPLTNAIARMPDRGLLSQAAPISIWEEAIKQALRSDHKRHKTGCVITNYKHDILTKGCSHTHDGGMQVRSIHAEVDALSKHFNQNWALRRVVIVTLTKVGNFATSSKPCAGCAKALMDVSVEEVCFVEKANDDSWVLVVMSPWEIYGVPTRYQHPA